MKWHYCATEWKKIERRVAAPTGPLLIPPGGKDAGIAELDPHPAFGLVPLEEGTVGECRTVLSSLFGIG